MIHAIVVHGACNLRAQSVRILMALAAVFGFRVWTEDITRAFIQSTGSLLRDVYVEPPLELKLDSDIVLKLLKPLYGLGDSGDYWSSTLRDHHRVD
jgi:hypothetical protein